MDKIDLRDVVLRTFLEYGINECSENDLTKIDLAECAEAIVEKLTLHDVSGLLLAKRRLYSMLIEKDGGKNESGLTDNEIELMYLLSCDKQIQDYLTECNNR